LTSPTDPFGDHAPQDLVAASRCQGAVQRRGRRGLERPRAARHAPRQARGGRARRGRVRAPAARRARAGAIGEIERGIRKARDAELALTLWLEELLRFYADRILPVTPDIARRWGRLSADIGHEGADLLVAATAAAHGLTVATRNGRHFAPTGVTVFDPFKAAVSAE
jgi:predicted nucleic acid-binding protein